MLSVNLVPPMKSLIRINSVGAISYRLKVIAGWIIGSRSILT